MVDEALGRRAAADPGALRGNHVAQAEELVEECPQQIGPDDDARGCQGATGAAGGDDVSAGADGGLGGWSDVVESCIGVVEPRDRGGTGPLWSVRRRGWAAGAGPGEFDAHNVRTILLIPLVL